MVMEEFWKRRAEEVVPGLPCVALTPEPMLLARETRSTGLGDAEPKGQVLSHRTRTQLGAREPPELAVKRQ